MLDEIWVKIILTIVGIVTTGSCGYLSAKVKNYSQRLKKKEENEDTQNKALLMLLQFQLTNTFFVYSEMGKIPDYVYKNWSNLLGIYEKLGGDDYVHVLEEKMKSWEFIKTDILTK